MKPYHLPKQLKFLRYQNSQGKVIPMHHAFKTVELTSVSRMTALVLPVFFIALIWLCMPLIFDLWAGIFSFWMQHIYQGQVGYESETILGQEWFFPYPMLDAEAPSNFAVWCNIIICLLVFIVSFIFRKLAIPFTYLCRTLLIIQASASLDRLISPDFFPYTLKIYMLDALMLSIYMLIILPILLGVVYYIFDFSIGRKCLLTVMMIGYYLLFIPCQYMLHAYIIHEYTMLMLPLLYMFFGVLMNVLAFVSIYAFGMSWRSRVEAIQGRGV